MNDETSHRVPTNCPYTTMRAFRDVDRARRYAQAGEELGNARVTIGPSNDPSFPYLVTVQVWDNSERSV